MMKFSSLLIGLFLFLAPPTFASPEKIEVAGTIRGTSQTGWYLIKDKTHAPINIESVEIKNEVVILKFTFEAALIHTFIATPDDTFVLKGYSVGASVNSKSANIVISQYIAGESKIVKASEIDEKWGNIWFYGLFTIDDENI